MSGRGRAHDPHRREPPLVAGARRQRQVLIGALARAGAALPRVAQVVREPPRPRIDVHRPVVDVTAAVEDHLGAVAVVRVDVEYGDPSGSGREQRLGRDRGVVEVAGTAVGGAGGVMARRAA